MAGSTSSTNGTNSSYSFSGYGVTNAAAVESMFNFELQKYCRWAIGCRIWAKIYEVYGNGTLVPLTG
jgi:hypothetical protein